MAGLSFQDVRGKYPQYGDLSDADLASALHKKFYADMPEDQFNQKIGYTPAPPAAPPAPKETGVVDVVKGVGDAALSGVNKVAGGVVGSGLGLVNRLVAAANGGDPQAASDTTKEYVQQHFGYDTKTPVGQMIGSAVQRALAPVGNAVESAGNAIESGGEKIGIPRGETHGALSELGEIANVAPIVGGVAKGAQASSEAASMAKDAALHPARVAGFRTAEDSPIAAGVAGAEGHDALHLHNQQIGNVLANAEANVPHGQALTPESLNAARAAPNSVYERVAAALPASPELSPQARTLVKNAGDSGRITSGTPDAANSIAKIRGELLNPAEPLTGDKVVAEMRGLRYDGYRNIGSEDTDKQLLGRAQLDMSRALEQHVADTLPADSGTSLEQLKAARQALAKNHAIEAATVGKNVDLAAIGRMHRADSGVLTGGLKVMGDFANENPTAVRLGQKVEQPSFARDVGAVIGGSKGAELLSSPLSAVSKLFGAQKLGRAVLTGNTDKAAAAAREQFPNRPPGDFAPIPAPPLPPGTIPFTPPAGPAPLSLAPEGAPPAAPGTQGGVSLADLLSHGVEQGPPAGLSLAPEGAPSGAGGLPFKIDPAHAAGDLSLAGETAPNQNVSRFHDLASVLSGGVPEGDLMRSGGSKAHMRLADFLDPNAEHITLESPEGTAFEPNQPDLYPKNNVRPAPGKPPAPELDLTSPEGRAGQDPAQHSLFENNASGESEASLEAINRVKQEKAAGQGRFLVDPDGNMTPLKGVGAVDKKAPKGSIIIQRGVGSKPYTVLDRGGLPQSHAEGLLNRALFHSGPRLGDLLGAP